MTRRPACVHRWGFSSHFFVIDEQHRRPHCLLADPAYNPFQIRQSLQFWHSGEHVIRRGIGGGGLQNDPKQQLSFCDVSMRSQFLFGFVNCSVVRVVLPAPDCRFWVVVSPEVVTVSAPQQATEQLIADVEALVS